MGRGFSRPALRSDRSVYLSKLVTYYFRGENRLGAWAEDGVIDLHRAYREMLRERGEPRADIRAEALVPSSMADFLAGEDESTAAAKQAIEWVGSKRDAGAPNSALRCLKDLGVWFEHSEIRLGPPIPKPPHLLALAFNYRHHSGEINVAIPPYPNVFTKEGKVIGPGEAIEIPDKVEQTDYEGELAVVIGKRARAVPRESAYTYVAGYAVFNDVTSRDYQFRVSQYTLLGKSIDTFSAMGPFLVLKDDIPDPQRIITRPGW
jgi:acylpyruvate hydrolase